ncbi:MAG: reverse transcriptase/maturase family protein [candidate division KSB1 bacterium]|nr:reverse transcriptase/maturase family protein [candidate division KSB1 bacterium]
MGLWSWAASVGANRAPAWRGWSISTTVIVTTTMSSTTTMCVECVAENHHPLFNFPRVYRAYLACRRTKRNKPGALAFERNYEENLMALVEELRERRYQPSTSICFYTERPKPREIFAAAFRDSIVHHLVYESLLPVWEPVFIHHSYACRPNKGTHAAAKALQKFLRQVTANGTRPAHFLKMDMENFFMTIDRRKLFEMLAARCHDPDLLWLLHVIVFHDPTKDYELQDRDNLRHALPPHKSLFHAKPFCGLPIGNLTSQLFANVYLNELDQFIKHVLKCRFYMRYVDDIVLLDALLEKLRAWQPLISNFVAERLAIAINERATRLAPVAGGVDFAGFIVRHDYMLVRRRVIGNLKARLRRARRQLVCYSSQYTAFRFHQETLAQILATVNSYLGHFKHAQSRRIVKKIWQKYSFIRRFFKLSSHKLTRLDQPLRRLRTLRQQVQWVHHQFKDHLCLIEIGCYFEAFDAHAKRLAQSAGLRLQKDWRGFAYGCGFPRRLLMKVLAELKRQKIPAVIVRETGRELYKTKERLPELILEYPENP